MKISELAVENFRCFSKGIFKFSDITLIAGPNSSGKTSVLSMLAAILQTKKTTIYPFGLDLNGSYVQLGSFSDVIKNDADIKRFSYKLSLKQRDRNIIINAGFRHSSKTNSILPDNISYGINGYGFDVKWLGYKEGYQAKSSGLDWMDNTAQQKSQKLMQAFAYAHDSDIKDEFIENFFEKLKSGTENWVNLKGRNVKSIISELSSDPAFLAHVQEVRRISEILTEMCAYVGPIRPYPERFYRERTLSERLDALCGDAYQYIYNWKKHNKEKYEDFVDIIAQIEMASDFSAKTIKGDLLEYVVKPYAHEEKVNVVDVGFGISQIVPVIVADINLPKGGTLIVNQPEVHLHPSSQALLANYMKSRVDRRSYIVETHSEYIINRFRQLVTSGQMDSKSIAIIYIDPKEKNEDGSIVHNVKIGENGALIGAPSGFFKTYQADIHDIAMNVIK